MNKPATMHQLECMELAALNAQTDKRRMQERIDRAESIAAQAERRRRAEQEKHEREMEIILYGVSAFSCLITTVSLIFTAPWWTAVAPMALAMLILRKAGW